MSFDTAALAAHVAARGPVVRVVVADVAGSAPREVGASVTVWADGQDGTIGGGTLEYEAVERARAMLTSGENHLTRSVALGPDMGQCCGGRVRLLWERFAAGTLPEGAVFARPIAEGDMPLSVSRVLSQSRDRGIVPAPALIDGWLVEPITTARTPVWIWGAGHVGRALVDVLAPLPDVAITWLDTGPERFPDDVPQGVTALPAPELAAAARLAPSEAQHIVMTYSHALDLAICDGLLARGFAEAGLIGSATKWARFRKRLAEAGHAPAAVDRIRCPIGDKSLGKHPAAIAIGVAHKIMNDKNRAKTRQPTGDRGERDERRLSGD